MVKEKLMFLLIKCLICIILLFYWLKACKMDLIQTLGNFFFILFIVTLFYDIFALNQKLLTLTNQQGNLFHLILDRTFLLPLSLFFLLNIFGPFFLKVLVSISWIFFCYYLEILNNQFHIVNLNNWTLNKAAFMGSFIIVLSLIMSYALKMLTRSSLNHAPTE